MKKILILSFMALVLLSLPVFGQTVDERYVEYNETAFRDAEGKIRVLFFHASWCPMCKSADANFKRNVSEIPEDVVVFKLDYDAERALKTKFSVTSQHTFVQVDEKGNQVTKWSGGDVKNLVSKIKTN